MSGSSQHIRIVTLDELNKDAENTEKFIADSEKQYTAKITEAAQRIADCYKEKPLVLLSGPSGSGKTTTAYRIAKQLADNGVVAFLTFDVCSPCG